MGIVWTLRARGLAPSLGAGGALVVASLCCLLLASVLLTVRDWPGRGDASPGGEITMTPPAAKAAGRAASGPSTPAAAAVTVAAPAAAGERAARTRPGRRTAPRRRGAAPQAPAGTSPPAASQPVTAPAPAPAVSAPSEDAPRDPGRDPSPLPELPLPQPQPGAGTVESVVETVEKPLPPAVREPIEPVLDTVHQVGRTVDGVTGQLLPALP